MIKKFLKTNEKKIDSRVTEKSHLCYLIRVIDYMFYINKIRDSNFGFLEISSKLSDIVRNLRSTLIPSEPEIYVH